MKKTLLTVGVFVIAVIGFQNCNSNLSPQIKDNTVTARELDPIENLDVSQTETLEIPENAFLNSQSSSQIDQMKTSGAPSRLHLSIDIKNGIAQVLDQTNQPVSGAKFCLSPDETAALGSILDSSKVCAGTVYSDGTVCTAVITEPYAKLHFAEGEINLGQSAGACNYGPDLCGEQKTQLRQFLKLILQDLASRSCQ